MVNYSVEDMNNLTESNVIDLRSVVKRMIVGLMRVDIKKSDVSRLLYSMHDFGEANMLDFLQFILQILNGNQIGKPFYNVLNMCGGATTFFDLLQNQNEEIRCTALKIIGKVLQFEHKKNRLASYESIATNMLLPSLLRFEFNINVYKVLLEMLFGSNNDEPAKDLFYYIESNVGVENHSIIFEISNN